MAFLRKAALFGGFLSIFVLIFGLSYGFVRVTAWLAYLPVVPGLLAFLLWCVTDTDLKAEYVTNSEGRITLSRVLAAMVVQIGLWGLVFFLTGKIVRHLPRFLVTGWRLLLVDFGASLCRWIALLLILQYAWTLLSATGKTAVVAVMARFGSRWALDSLDRGYGSFGQMERRGPKMMRELQEEKSGPTKRSGSQT